MTELLHRLRIGRVTLPNNLVLSPMAGFSDLPFRILCRRHGAGLVSSEMVAAESIERGVTQHLVRMRTLPEERPTSVQIFGSDPPTVALAAKEAQEHCDILGFNMGCPAHQIKAQGCGAALLDHPELAQELVASIKSASDLPLLVKMRAGNQSQLDAATFAEGLERAGADGLIVHARTAAQGYSGRADWRLIREVKASVNTPVVGNGDIVDGPSAEAALRESSADGLALGRATLGDPRVFGRIGHYLETGEVLPPPTLAERVEDFLSYLEMAEAADLPTPHILQQAQRFTRGVRGGAEMRTRLHGARFSHAAMRAEFEALLSA